MSGGKDGERVRLLKPEELAPLVGLEVAEVKAMARSGELPHIRFSSHTIRFKLDEVRRAMLSVRVAEAKRTSEEKNVPRLDDIPEALAIFSRRLCRLRLADQHRVYFLLKEGEIVYVGQSKNLLCRLSAHFADKDFDDILYFDIDPADALAIEAEFINHLTPVYNKPFDQMDQATKDRWRQGLRKALLLSNPEHMADIANGEVHGAN